MLPLLTLCSHMIHENTRLFLITLSISSHNTTKPSLRVIICFECSAGLHLFYITITCYFHRSAVKIKSDHGFARAELRLHPCFTEKFNGSLSGYLRMINILHRNRLTVWENDLEGSRVGWFSFFKDYCLVLRWSYYFSSMQLSEVS